MSSTQLSSIATNAGRYPGRKYRLATGLEISRSLWLAVVFGCGKMHP